MRIIKFIFNTIINLIKIVAYEWIISLINIVKRLCKSIKAMCSRPKLTHWDKHASAAKCGPIEHPAFHRPDPCIYSQRYLTSLGLPVTWDNPDIIIRKNGVIVAENELLPDTDYEVSATVWNNSYEAPAAGLIVDFTFLSFGIGTVTNVIGSTVVNVGVKGSASQPAFAKIIWRTPSAGHYCLQADLRWADDANPANNFGQNNVNIVEAHSPAAFDFQVRNSTRKKGLFTFEKDTYTLLNLDDCNTSKRNPDELRSVRIKRVVAKHKNQDFTIPETWAVEIIPNEIILDVNQETTIQVRITPPEDFSGLKPFNINGFCGGKFMGGVTLYVKKQS